MNRPQLSDRQALKIVRLDVTSYNGIEADDLQDDKAAVAVLDLGAFLEQKAWTHALIVPAFQATDSLHLWHRVLENLPQC